MNTTPVLALLFALAPLAHADSNPIANFHEVEPGVFRGASPGAAGVAYLKSLGVKTVLDLDNDQRAIRIEQAAEAASGVQRVAIPMSGFWAPKKSDAEQAVDVLADPQLRPIFVHCKHGQDRTGLVVGLYRVEVEHWQPAHAYEEMKALGFHPLLVFLNHFFEKMTGFED